MQFRFTCACKSRKMMESWVWNAFAVENMFVTAKYCNFQMNREKRKVLCFVPETYIRLFLKSQKFSFVTSNLPLVSSKGKDGELWDGLYLKIENNIYLYIYTQIKKDSKFRLTFSWLQIKSILFQPEFLLEFNRIFLRKFVNVEPGCEELVSAGVEWTWILQHEDSIQPRTPALWTIWPPSCPLSCSTMVNHNFQSNHCCNGCSNYHLSQPRIHEK